MARLYTIGHSNRSIEEFLTLLKAYGIETLIDIRSLPGSSKFPSFNSKNLEKSLLESGFHYEWLPKLGGFRRSGKGFQSINMGLSSPGFRSYADYIGTDEFRSGARELIQISSISIAACMCAEAVYWRCNRRLLSDYMVAHGIDVIHILRLKQVSPHKMTPGSLVTSKGDVIYPKSAVFQPKDVEEAQE